MITLRITNDNAKDWFPVTYSKFIENLRNSESSSFDCQEEMFEWHLLWGFFVKKANSEEEKIAQMDRYMSKMNLIYDDRVELELPRIRCSLSMKAGYYHIMDRTIDETPVFVQDMAREIIKVMMIEEQDQIGDQIVMDSIRGFYESIIANEDNDSASELSIDAILDKINESGMKSLNSVELGYLKDMSGGKS